MIPESQITDKLFREVVGKENKRTFNIADWKSLLYIAIGLCCLFAVGFLFSYSEKKDKETRANTRRQTLLYYENKDFTVLHISRDYDHCNVAIQRNDIGGLQEIVHDMPVGLFKLGKYDLICP